MGRRAKYYTLADRAVAAKARNAVYSQTEWFWSCFSSLRQRLTNFTQCKVIAVCSESLLLPAYSWQTRAVCISLFYILFLGTRTAGKIHLRLGAIEAPESLCATFIALSMCHSKRIDEARGLVQRVLRWSRRSHRRCNRTTKL